jgi:hypothetical protein
MLHERMNRTLSGAVAFAIAGGLFAGQASGGVAGRDAGGVIISTTSLDMVTGLKRTQRTILSGRMVRTEESGKSSIVSADAGGLWESSSRGQSCIHYSASDLAGLRRTAEEEMRRTLESTGSVATPGFPGFSYRKLGTGETVGKWKCDRFAKELNGVKISEVSVVPLSAVKLSRADLGGLADAGRVMGGAPSTWDQETLSLLENATSVGYDAFPVRIAVFDGSGQARFVSELSSLTFRRIPSKAFQPPERCTPAASILTR